MFDYYTEYLLHLWRHSLPRKSCQAKKSDPKPLLTIMGGCLGSNRHRDHSSRESSDVAGSMFP